MKTIAVTILALLFSWALLCTVQTGSGPQVLRTPSSKSSYPVQQRSPAYVQDSNKTESHNEKIEEENREIEDMKEEAEELEEDLKALENDGGG